MPGQRYLERTWALEGAGGFAYPLAQQIWWRCATRRRRDISIGRVAKACEPWVMASSSFPLRLGRYLLPYPAPFRRPRVRRAARLLPLLPADRSHRRPVRSVGPAPAPLASARDEKFGPRWPRRGGGDAGEGLRRHLPPRSVLPPRPRRPEPVGRSEPVVHEPALRPRQRPVDLPRKRAQGT